MAAVILEISKLCLKEVGIKEKPRDSLTLHISFSSGKSWKKNILIEPKYKGYSDIGKISKKKIGVLYEADGYEDIRFQIKNW